jgi:V8-like Glu-specific endopeptidase
LKIYNEKIIQCNIYSNAGNSGSPIYIIDENKDKIVIGTNYQNRGYYKKGVFLNEETVNWIN